MPYGTIKYTKLYRELIYANPALELVPYSVKEYLDTVIVTGDIKDNVIQDIMILDKDKDGNRLFYPDYKGYFFIFNREETLNWFKPALDHIK